MSLFRGVVLLSEVAPVRGLEKVRREKHKKVKKKHLEVSSNLKRLQGRPTCPRSSTSTDFDEKNVSRFFFSSGKLDQGG